VEDVDELLAPWREAPARAVILTDFDGTLAPIVDDPAAARPLPGTEGVLSRLSHRFGRVGVVSGRPVSFLTTHLGGSGAALWGLYGLERAVGDRVVEVPAARRWREVVAEVADAAEAEAPAGVGVERKGLSVTLHTRTAPSETAWASAWAARAASGSGLVVHPGRMSVELRPPIDVDKGTAVRELGRDMAAVCFFGDDSGDLPAFAALAELRDAGAQTLAVAVRSGETPPALIEAADAIAAGPEDVLAILGRLGED